MKITRSAITMSVLLITLMVGMAGWFKPLDELLRSVRFSTATRPVTGEVVFVDIDAKSLQHVGVWPWPRGIHAQVIDKLMDAGALDVSFDVDFSAASSELEDAKLERALADSGGYVTLATFSQPIDNNGGRIINLPLPRFAQFAETASVNVPIDSDGIVRTYGTSFNYGDVHLPTMGAALALGPKPAPGRFRIDFGIDVTGVPRLSVRDLLDGTFNPAVVANKHVVLGASALELRDTLAVPRYGTLPGALVHVIAAETLLQNRALRHVPAVGMVVLALLLAGAVTVSLRRFSERNVVLGSLAVLAAVEIFAWIMQAHFALAVDTVVVHASVLGVGFVGFMYELGEQGLLLDRTARAHARTRSVLDRVILDNFDGVLVINHDESITLASQMAETSLGKEGRASIVGLSVARLLPEGLVSEIRTALHSGIGREDAKLRQFRFCLDNGDDRVLEYVITVTSLSDEGAGETALNQRVACMTFRDVTDRHKAEQRLTYLATHDPLTGAFSRAHLVALMHKAFEHRRLDAGEGITLLLVDLSRFKEVNDTLGHSYGDMLLKQIVQRLRQTVTGELARLGGDNFAVMIPQRLSESEASELAQAMLDALVKTYQLDEHRAMVGAKIGISDSSHSGADPELLIAHADMALSRAKQQPGSCYAFFSPDLDVKLRETQVLELALRHAIFNDEVRLVYQPQVSLDDGKLVGVEALVRWRHPELGAVPPSKFIPMAEETGLILELGNWILEHACVEAARWPVPIPVAVNVSPLQFEFCDMVERVRLALEASGLPAHRLDIEVTEGLLVSNSGMIIDKLDRLRDLGVGIALDDFGTGYSSLSYLGRLPIDKIKIDQSFVRGLPGSDESGAIVRAIMTLSESLGKTVVAEGIENADQAWMLHLAGCHVGQGYYYGRPMGSEELAARFDTLLEGRPHAKVG